MHTPLLIGVLVAFAVATLGSGLFFFSAWRERRAGEYFYFSLVSLCVAAQLAFTALLYGHAVGFAPISIDTIAILLGLPAKIGAAFLLHFALLYGGHRKPWPIMTPVYGIAAAMTWVVLSGGWWTSVPHELVPMTLGGMDVHAWEGVPSRLALPFWAGVLAVLIAVSAIIARVWLRDRRGGRAAFFGHIVMCLAVFNDVGLRFGWFPSVPILPLGFFAFSFGVSVTLIGRYGRAASTLALRSEELQQRSAELDASVRELKQTQQDLLRSEQLAVVGELAAVIAHEVRNPLAIVNNAVASLRKRHTTVDDRRTLLEIINEEMARLDKLVSRLLNYARPVVVNRERVALRELIVRSLTLIEDKPDVNAELSFAGGANEVPGDADLLRQVFENIVTNAVQAMHDKGTLRVNVRAEKWRGERVVSIELVDDGEGMSKQACASALSPFFTTRPTGTGLGLPIVVRIIEAHGGALEIDSRIGDGTTVRILLPQQAGVVLAGDAEDPQRISLLP